jgi:CRISPR-associated protein Csd1
MLEENRTDRSYLYGRLLAIADQITDYELFQREELERFARHPASTWLKINTKLYRPEYRIRRKKYDDLLQKVICMFATVEDFTSDEKLEPIYWLAYDLQRGAMGLLPIHRNVGERSETNPAGRMERARVVN